MIVTKKMEQQYILKRACYLIEQDGDGNFKIVGTSINWREGMEVFETVEECSREIDRRVAALMKPGDCPRCHHKSVFESEVDISILEKLPQEKFGDFYRCARCETVWYTKTGAKQLLAYDKSIGDYVLEWAQRNLKPASQFNEALSLIKNISSDKHYEAYPAHVIMKDGRDFQCAMIYIEQSPPGPSWYTKKNFFYLDQVAEIKPSEFAYPYAIAKRAWYLRTTKPFEFALIKETNTKKIYGFEVHTGLFRPHELVGKDLELADASSVKEYGDVFYFAEPHERGGSDQWRLSPPPETVSVWGDL
jgi:hypothetical protein